MHGVGRKRITPRVVAPVRRRDPVLKGEGWCVLVEGMWPNVDSRNVGGRYELVECRAFASVFEFKYNADVVCIKPVNPTRITTSGQPKK